MKIRLLVAVVAGAGALAACGSPSHAPAEAAGDRRAALHAAAQCIRDHGVPTYADPVLTADGHVYTDARSIEEASDGTVNAVRRACAQLITAAGFRPDDEAPATPAMVGAGVRAARCLRANGLPNYRDPTSSTRFVPGHGFSITDDEIPPGGKQNPALQRAISACRTLLDEEIRLSSLSNLARG